ncbi:MAG: recombinase family protein [Planctomycetota bacterium]|jgi:hypothetical protein
MATFLLFVVKLRRIASFLFLKSTPEKDLSVNQVLKLNKGDVLLVAELSRLSRNKFGIINLINQFIESGVEIVFVRQPELSTIGPQSGY